MMPSVRRRERLLLSLYNTRGGFGKIIVDTLSCRRNLKDTHAGSELRAWYHFLHTPQRSAHPPSWIMVRYDPCWLRRCSGIPVMLMSGSGSRQQLFEMLNVFSISGLVPLQSLPTPIMVDDARAEHTSSMQYYLWEREAA